MYFFYKHVLVLSSYLFSIGIYGLITSRNIVRALLCLELILNAVNINLVTFFYFFDNPAKAVIGLTIFSLIYRNKKSIHINQSNLLNK
ncbi:hypothetical protein K2173_004861 [Erythroxylum novogranatense]|uniref:NADH dehydrogenase subunit 4L n=1 Tax=Erythroxylum novogranatense TaxID=1862640 RepID=A0AAV8UC78_9ROSI|nr:hypothetical protein K2173_004861 [Erythroxylum novogranatense]